MFNLTNILSTILHNIKIQCIIRGILFNCLNTKYLLYLTF